MYWGVAPARERGLKCQLRHIQANQTIVAPARERGLKWVCIVFRRPGQICRSREGAWIEIQSVQQRFEKMFVAPARERGLK